MYSEQLTSPIAQFLAMQTDHMKQVRDHLPSGPENFKFYQPEGEIDWYQFWSYIAEHRPVNCAMETDWYKIYFDSSSLKWKGLNKAKDPYFDKYITHHTAQLNEYEIRAQSIRNWIRYNANKK